MTGMRVTQGMVFANSLSNLQASLSRYAATQEQLTTGKRLNRASDSPSDAAASMKTRVSLADQAHYLRNADNGLGWLGTADTALSTMGDDVRRARDLGLQGVSTGTTSPTAREALAVEVDQLRADVITQANSTYLGRPIFGGTTAGSVAFDTTTGAYVGDTGQVTRTVGDGVKVRVDVPGTDVMGPNGNSLVDDLSALSSALRSGDEAGMRTALSAIEGRQTAITTARTNAGAAYNRVESASQKAKDAQVTLKSALSDLEDADLPQTIMTLQMQETAYQAALAGTAKVMQPSLIDFLR